ncbi:TIGR04157 family glycosyltransferase [uncultured Parabacteroides sp.]|uniref:TIGR04157 family glycosyltransferase n=1 Tax=uncultured Parabacteroides sp. TaxID=512312 RepID=UPI00280594E9|nr:TIGR04157 family glycosyltransferase [uncultured Parabacteroides sp.]
MNLYIFNQTRRGSVFGVGTYIRELSIAMKRHDLNIWVINLISEKPQIQIEEIDGIKYCYFPLAIADRRKTSDQEQWELYYRNVVYWLRLHIQDKEKLVFHLNFFESKKLAQELKVAFKCKVIAVSHFFDWGFVIYDNPKLLQSLLEKENPNDLEQKLQTNFKIEKDYYSTVDHIICISHYMKEMLCQYYQIGQNKVSVVPNGLSDMNETPSDIDTIRKKWHIPIKEKIILFAGRLDEVKGVLYLVKAFREVLKYIPNCRLVMVGSGDYDKCFRECKDIYSKIIFTGLLEKQELHKFYTIADIGVIPSLFEPFGFVAVEMMMHSLPIIVTATSGLNEVVDDNCGIKIPLTILQNKVEIDSSLLAEKIVWLLDHSTIAKQIGENGRKRFLCNYSTKIFGENMLHTYQSIEI